MPEYSCQKPLLAEGIDNGKSIGNGGKQHGQHRHCLNQLFILPAQIRIVDTVSHDKSQQRRHQRTGTGYEKAVSKSLQKTLLSKHFTEITRSDASVFHEGFQQQLYHGRRQENQKDCAQNTENNLNLFLLHLRYDSLPL